MLQMIGNGWGANIVGISVVIVMPLHTILLKKKKVQGDTRDEEKIFC